MKDEGADRFFFILHPSSLILTKRRGF